MALIKCRECGHDVSTEAVKCPNCGAPVKKLDETQKTIPTEPIAFPFICPHCGYTNILPHKLCMKCNQELRTQPSEGTRVNSKAETFIPAAQIPIPKKGPTWTRLNILLFVLGVLWLLVIIRLKCPDNQTSSQTGQENAGAEKSKQNDAPVYRSPTKATKELTSREKTGEYNVVLYGVMQDSMALGADGAKLSTDLPHISASECVRRSDRLIARNQGTLDKLNGLPSPPEAQQRMHNLVVSALSDVDDGLDDMRSACSDEVREKPAYMEKASRHIMSAGEKMQEVKKEAHTLFGQ